MKKYILLVTVIALFFASCSKAPKGYTHYSLDNGKVEVNLPDDFSSRKDSTYHIDPVKKHDVKTFKFSSKKDTANAIGVAYSMNADTKQTVDKFLSNITMEAAQSPIVKLKTNDTMRLNGQLCGVVTYTMMKDNVETDFSRIIFTILNSEIYTLNIYFKGAVKPEYSTMAETVTKSFTIKQDKK